MKLASKSTAIVLTLSIALTFFAGCGGNNSGIDSDSADTSDNAVVETLDDDGRGDIADDNGSTDAELPDDDGKGDIVDDNGNADAESTDEKVSVADDFAKFINEDMAEVNENYNKLTAEIGNWDIEDFDGIKTSISTVLLPLIGDSFEKLAKAMPKTDEIRELKSKYSDILTGYREGLGEFLDALESNDEGIASSAMEKITDAMELIDEYNAELEKIAEANDLTVEY